MADIREMKVAAFMQRLYCACGDEMMSTGHGVSNTWGTSWQHKCPKCGSEDWTDVTYPNVIHKEIADED